jgi:uncharacterized tellurite resistance protein B-like protein
MWEFTLISHLKLKKMPTQFIQKMNKTEAGFHILMILSLVDGNIISAESSVVIEFLDECFQQPIEIIKEQAFIRACPEEERLNHFTETAQQFFKISSIDERNKLLSFAMKVVMADDKMENEENVYINTLYDCWGLE